MAIKLVNVGPCELEHIEKTYDGVTKKSSILSYMGGKFAVPFCGETIKAGSFTGGFEAAIKLDTRANDNFINVTVTVLSLLKVY